MLASHCCKVLCDGKVLRNELMSRCIIPCSAHVPAAKFAQRFWHQTAKDCTQMLLHRGMLLYRMLLHTGAFAQRCFSQRHLFIYTCMHIQMLLPEVLVHTKMPLRRGAFTQWCFYTGELLHADTQVHLHTDAFTQACFSTGMFLHTCAFTRGFFWHRVAFTHRNFYTHILLRRDVFTQKYIHLHKGVFYTDAFTQRRFCTDTFAQRCFYTQVLLD